jgi:hypothetical protein
MRISRSSRTGRDYRGAARTIQISRLARADTLEVAKYRGVNQMATAAHDLPGLARLHYVEGMLNFIDRSGPKPVNYMYAAPEGATQRSGRYEKHAVSIYDMRPLLDEVSLDREGFAVVHQESAVRNFYDSTEVVARYYPEVERLVREHTGAVKVHVFDHNVRNRSRAERRENGVYGPVKFAHNDYTPKSGPQRVRDLLPDEAEALLKNRFAVVNVWRPIRGPVEESPLAVCDGRSMEQRDFIEQDLIYRDRKGEVYAVAYNPDHRWFYVGGQRRDEVLLLKCYDSDPHVTRFTAHSAFEDPTSAPDTAPRESIEVRTLVFFQPGH